MAEPPSVAFYTDPGAFLAVADEYLSANVVVANVVVGRAHQTRSRVERGEDPAAGIPYFWFATVCDTSTPERAGIGAAMRTASFAPHPLYVLPMPSDAADALVAAVQQRGEPVTSVYGASPAAERVFEGCTGLAPDDATDDQERLRLHELPSHRHLRNPRGVAGRLRRPRTDEAALLVTWLDAFMREADEQAGRARHHTHHGGRGGRRRREGRPR